MLDDAMIDHHSTIAVISNLFVIAVIQILYLTLCIVVCQDFQCFIRNFKENIFKFMKNIAEHHIVNKALISFTTDTLEIS